MSLYSDLTEVLTPYANKIKELNGSVEDYITDLSIYNSIDVFKNALHKNKITDTLECSWNTDKSITIVGTTQSTVTVNMWSSSMEFPNWLTAGEQYFLIYESDSIYFRIQDKTYDTVDIVNSTNSYFGAVTIPQNCTKILIQIQIPSGTYNETIKPVLLNSPSNDILNKYSLQHGIDNATKIIAGDDLFSLSPGAYFSAVGSPNVLNCPTSQTFRLEIICRNTTNTYIAILIDAKNRIFITNKTSTNIWNPWKQLATAEEINNLSVTVDTNKHEIDEIQSSILTVEDLNYNISENKWESGSINTNGIDEDNTTRIRTIDYYNCESINALNININTGYKCAIVWYNNDSLLYDHYWLTEKTRSIKPNSATRFRVVFARTDGADIEISECDNIVITGDYNLKSYISNIQNLTANFQKAILNINTEPITISSVSITRRSTIISVTEPCWLNMTSAVYLFRLYWYENSELHSTAWARSWWVPQNVIVGITIKRNDGASMSDLETPEKYLTTQKIVKDYYKTEIENVVGRVKAANTEPGLCFLLSTDHHTMSVQGTLEKYDTISDMVINMRELTKKINFDANICLGDVADFKVGDAEHFAKYGILDNTNYNSVDELFYKWMDEAMDKLASVHPNFIYTIGNHDDNRYINKDKVQAQVSSYDYTLGEMYSYYTQRSQLRRVPNLNNNGLDFYIDFPDYKIRMFCLDSSHWYDETHASSAGQNNVWWYGFQDNTVTWLREQLSNIPSGWSVLTLSHMSPVASHNAGGTNYINMEEMQSVIQDFIDDGGDYIATLYGHSHGDWSTTIPWLEIAFNCQKCQNSTTQYDNMPGMVHPTRTQGTATEDCWDVVIIQPLSRKIKTIRFGAGNDRTFTY